ncbi:MAG: hypothetical protein HQ556_13590 [Candidatus Marinimicrobia bacterium]|nr:hypothetical protein [Candidatus Neomarinimicrobiota bacterium]
MIIHRRIIVFAVLVSVSFAGTYPSFSIRLGGARPSHFDNRWEIWNPGNCYTGELSVALSEGVTYSLLMGNCSFTFNENYLTSSDPGYMSASGKYQRVAIAIRTRPIEHLDISKYVSPFFTSGFGTMTRSETIDRLGEVEPFSLVYKHAVDFALFGIGIDLLPENRINLFFEYRWEYEINLHTQNHRPELDPVNFDYLNLGFKINLQ